MRETSLAFLLFLGLKSQSLATRSHSSPGLSSSLSSTNTASACLVCVCVCVCVCACVCMHDEQLEGLATCKLNQGYNGGRDRQ